MAAKLAEAVLVLTVDDKQMKAALGQIPKDAATAATSVKSISQAVDFAVFEKLAKYAAQAFGAIVGGIIELGNRGAQVDDVANSFEILTAKTGETADVMLGKLREGVVGTLSDYDLMTLANKTLGSGLIKTSEDMGVLAAGARTLAKATGETTKEAFDTLTSAMASGRTAALKQVGLFVDSKVALQDYSEAIGKNVDKFTDHDRATALSTAALAALRTRMQDIKPDAADFGELIDQAKVRLENFKDQIAVGIAKSPVFAAGMTAMGKALGDAFGSDNKAQASEMTKLIEEVGIKITYVAQGAIVLGTVFATVFSAIGVLVNGALTIVVGFATGIVTIVDGLARLGAALPGASDETKALAANTTELRTFLDGMTQSLAASTAESAKGVIGQSALHATFDKLGGIVMTVRDTMKAAEGKTAETTKAVVALGAGSEVAAGKTKEAANKIAEAITALNAEVVAGTKEGLAKRLFEIDTAREKELAGVKALKEGTDEQHAEMVRLITEKYAQRTEAARLAGDEIVARELGVQQDIALLLTTGTAHKLLQIQIARDKEIEAIALRQLTNQEGYDKEVAAITEKYRLQSEAANGYYATIELAAAASGFKTRAEMQLEADNAKRLYQEMLASGKFTYQALEDAKKKASDAAAALDKVETLGAVQKFELIAAAASGMLKSLFGKSKSAAIAIAIIDTIAAIVKTMAAYPWPWSLAPAAAAGAAGYAQVQAIRNQNADGFALGTPGLDFADFGAMSFQPLHNQEAVIPRGGGHILAGEIADAMPGQDELLSLTREIAQGIRELPGEIRRGFRNAMILDLA